MDTVLHVTEVPQESLVSIFLSLTAWLLVPASKALIGSVQLGKKPFTGATPDLFQLTNKISDVSEV